MDVDRDCLPVLIVLVAVLAMVLCSFRVRSLYVTGKGERRRLARFAYALLGFAATLLLFTTTWNALSVARFWSAHPPAGMLLTVSGHKMHLVCMGAGHPTLVLESGLGDDSFIWAGVQPALAHVTQVCSYDRAGLGWSDARDAPRDADKIAAELHQALAQAGIATPIVLMGHSIGGLYVREYRNRYPSQVAGMILVDTTTPYLDRIPAFASEISLPPSWIIRFAMAAGLPRVVGMCSKDAQGVEQQFRKVQAEDVCRLHYDEVAAELASFDRSSEEITRFGTYGQLPMLIFSQDPTNTHLGGKVKLKDLAEAAEWDRLQESLTALSTDSRRIIVPGSTHYVMLRRPDLVEMEVSRFINQLRAGNR